MQSPARAVAGQVHVVGHHAHAGGGDEYTVTLALLHHLGVAGDDVHAGLLGCLCHRHHNALQIGQREAFFEDEAGGQPKRRRPHHRHVVDGAVHRQTADIAAGKEQRRHHMAVGRHHQPAVRGRQQRAVVALAQIIVVESCGKQLFDQLRHGASAAAVAHIHAPVLDVQCADIILAYLAAIHHVAHMLTTSNSLNQTSEKNY